MRRWLLRIFGLLLGGYALLGAASSTLFARPGTAGQLEQVIWGDVRVGATLALAVVLVLLPAAGSGTPRRFWLTALAAVVIGGVVSGGLVWWHVEQHRIEKSKPRMGGE